MSIIIKAPGSLPLTGGHSVFLAGSIEMGTAEDWQKRAEDYLKDLDIYIFNPRRDDWDSTWEQSIGNPKFREQVEWELQAMNQAFWILMYFSPGTKSPITLLELGLHAKSGKLFVCCPEGFWRKGNVDIICQQYPTQAASTLPSILYKLHTHITFIQRRHE